MGWVEAIVVFLRALLRDRAELAAENLALRQQLAILEQRSKQPRLRKRDRIFWVWLSRLWGGWRNGSRRSRVHNRRIGVRHRPPAARTRLRAVRASAPMDSSALVPIPRGRRETQGPHRTTQIQSHRDREHAYRAHRMHALIKLGNEEQQRDEQNHVVVELRCG